MRKLSYLAFPVLFAVVTLGVFLILYPPAPHSAGMTSACLVFLTALGWSALIVFGRREMNGLKAAYATSALLVSVLVAGVLPPFPVDPLPHRLMVLVQALGMAGIVLYLHILKKKGESL